MSYEGLVGVGVSPTTSAKSPCYTVHRPGGLSRILCCAGPTRTVIDRLVIINSEWHMVLKFFEEMFYVLGGAILVFCIMELFWDRIVLSYININWVLIAWLIAGIIILVINNEKNG